MLISAVRLNTINFIPVRSNQGTIFTGVNSRRRIAQNITSLNIITKAQSIIASLVSETMLWTSQWCNRDALVGNDQQTHEAGRENVRRSQSVSHVRPFQLLLFGEWFVLTTFSSKQMSCDEMDSCWLTCFDAAMESIAPIVFFLYFVHSVSTFIAWLLTFVPVLEL